MNYNPICFEVPSFSVLEVKNKLTKMAEIHLNMLGSPFKIFRSKEFYGLEMTSLTTQNTNVQQPLQSKLCEFFRSQGQTKTSKAEVGPKACVAEVHVVNLAKPIAIAVTSSAGRSSWEFAIRCTILQPKQTKM